MRSVIGVAAVLVGLSLAASGATIGSDNSGNYSGGWTDGTNGGTGFGAWTLTSEQGTGSAGTFIGDPTSGGISGMGTAAFGMYANTNNSGASANAERNFSSALAVGDTFSMVWGVNWDSGAGGNKGLNLYAGATELININNAGSPEITINGNTMFTNYGVNAMTINFEYKNATTVRVFANGRDGTESFPDSDIAVLGAPTSFKLYASGMQAGDNAQPYFNDLTITSIPEPVSAALLGLGIGFVYLVRRKIQK